MDAKACTDEPRYNGIHQTDSCMSADSFTHFHFAPDSTQPKERRYVTLHDGRMDIPKALCIKFESLFTSVAVTAEISLRSPRKIFIFTIKNEIIRIKVSNKNLILTLKKSFTAVRRSAYLLVLRVQDNEPGGLPSVAIEACARINRNRSLHGPFVDDIDRLLLHVHLQYSSSSTVKPLSNMLERNSA